MLLVNELEINETLGVLSRSTAETTSNNNNDTTKLHTIKVTMLMQQTLFVIHVNVEVMTDLLLTLDQSLLLVKDVLTRL